MKPSRKSRADGREQASASQPSALDPRPSTPDQQFSAVILAGGKSSRMGRDKAWLEVGGRRLLDRQIELAREIGAEEVFISGRAEADYSGFNGHVLRDKFAHAGPLAGIERALAVSTSPRLLVLAVDLVAMNAELLGRLAAACTPPFGIIPRVAGNSEPLAAFYPKAAHALAAAQLAGGELAARAFAGRCVQAGFCRFIDLAAGDASNFANWNSPADMMRTAN